MHRFGGGKKKEGKGEDADSFRGRKGGKMGRPEEYTLKRKKEKKKAALLSNWGREGGGGRGERGLRPIFAGKGGGAKGERDALEGEKKGGKKFFSQERGGREGKRARLGLVLEKRGGGKEALTSAMRSGGEGKKKRRPGQ